MSWPLAAVTIGRMQQRPISLVVAAAAGLCAALLTGAGAAAGAVAGPAAGLAAAAGTWHTPVELPDAAALNAGGAAEIAALSCASPGNCSGGGVYHDGSARQQVFVASQVSGVWSEAAEVPGSGALNAGGVAELLSVSCASAGNCAAGGYYTDGSAHEQAFVAVQVKGKWKPAVEVPGTGSLNAGGNGELQWVSCRSAGNCSAGGYYTDGSAHGQAFVVSEVSGVWGAAKEVRGSGTLNAGGAAMVTSVSCASAGNCSAGGYYTDGSGHQQAFVVAQVKGKWGTAHEVPGSATLNKGGNGEVLSVSCGSAGNCAVGGYYTDGSGHVQAFTASQVNGTWGTAREVPGSGTLNKDGNARVASVSCASAGNCGEAGYYTDGSGHTQAFTAAQVKGKWRAAHEVPDSGTLNAGRLTLVLSVSCASPGNCAVSGQYNASFGGRRPFVASQVNGRWYPAMDVPGSPALYAGTNESEILSISCGSAGNCAAGGYYYDGSGRRQGYVVSQVSGEWAGALNVPGLGKLNGGGDAKVNAVSCASAGNCAAGGYYTSGAGLGEAFIASEVNGRWGPAHEVPGTGTLNKGGDAAIDTVSCASAGNCSASGYYETSSGHYQEFAVSELNGAWGTAKEIPGTGR